MDEPREFPQYGEREFPQYGEHCFATYWLDPHGFKLAGFLLGYCASVAAYLRDLLYLDTDKAASIFSQLHGGLVRETQESAEHGRERKRGLGLSIGPLRPEFAGVSSEKTSVIESRVLHHDLLIHIEEALFELGAAVDLNGEDVGAPGSAAEARAVIEGAAYVRAEGWAVIEDYDRIRRIAGEFPALLEFIQRCALSGVEGSDELRESRRQLEERKRTAERQPNKQARQRALREVARQERQFNETLRALVKPDDPPEAWLIEGIQRWIDVFLPGRITFRVYPFEALPEFQVLGNLKRDSFVDTDLGNLIFAYGTKPNVKLTITGLVTSLPLEDGRQFDPMSEFGAIPEGGAGEAVEFEKGFRGLFEGMEGLEAFSRFSRYPNVTIYPLAVYRRVEISAEESA